jgi:pimeloyl-ACP methyl ester carboxylesterase
MKTTILPALVMSVVGCALEPEPEIGARAQASTALDITPAVASYNADLAQPQAKHYTYVGGSGAGSGWLVVFLHGVGGQPSGYQSFMQRANAHGFHVIGLSYWDTGDYGTPRIENICNGLGAGLDTACWGDVRRNLFDGTSVPNASPAFPTHPTIKGRLDDLLAYLVTTDSSWTQFRESGHPRWSKIIIAGHSLGAGNAAWIAQHRAVHRLLMFSQPQDYVDAGGGTTTWADWIDDGFAQSLSGGPALPPGDMYGLAHRDDVTADYTRTMRNWGVFGMSGNHCIDPSCINVTCPGVIAPYCGARRFNTNLAGVDPHSDTAKDETHYGLVWDHMLTFDL